MTTAASLRRQIESSLADRIPSALTPRPQLERTLCPTGIGTLDQLLRGGLPVGALTELVGPECSGRTSLALSYVAAATCAGRVAAWVDVSDSMSPEAAAAAGIPLDRLLWVRCGACLEQLSAQPSGLRLPAKYSTPPSGINGIHGGGCGMHPRAEVKDLAGAVSALLEPAAGMPRSAEPLARANAPRTVVALVDPPQIAAPLAPPQHMLRGKPWSRMEQAMRATDLLLQTGGFAVIVLDMGSLPPEASLRVPLATWFRYRAAAERSQASVLLLSQSPCAKSSAGLVLRAQPPAMHNEESTVFTGIACQVEIVRERFQPSAKVVPMRKPPQRDSGAGWQARSVWAGAR